VLVAEDALLLLFVLFVLLVLSLPVTAAPGPLVGEVEEGVVWVDVAGSEVVFSFPVLVSFLVLSVPEADCAPDAACSEPLCAINDPLISSVEYAKAGTVVKTLNSKDA
jgi:hypothetical protein